MKNKLFLIILVLAFILRFYKLGEIPLSLDWDENSNAYNAYSILKTGRDEYGQYFPITNRSFDDYKPPLYMYLNIPAVAIFGLTPFAARIPSAIFGFLTVPFVYLLSKWLFKKESIALLSMFFIAISPWHLQFSRVGFEATVGLSLALAAITAFLYGIDNKKWLIPSGIFLGLSAYSYHSERIFVPLLFIAAFFVWRKQITNISKKYLFVFISTTIIIGLPLVILIPPKVILQRFEVTTGRPRLEDIEKSIKFILEDQERSSNLGKFIHNRRIVIGQTWLGNYLSHFDFNFLFTKGDDNFRHHIQDMGMLYFFELPLFIIGIYQFVKHKTPQMLFVLIWLIIAPIAATPATPNPHANRSLPMVIPLAIFSAYALLSFNQSTRLKIIMPIYCIIIVLSFFKYLHNYYVHYPIEKADFWQFGYREAVLESERLKNQFEKINIDRSIEQAYAFWLFNTKFDPENYQKNGNRYHFDKYYFDAKKPTNPQELFISEASAFPDGFKVLKTVRYPNGTEAIKIGHPR